MNKNKLLKILTSSVVGGTLATVSVLPFVLTTNGSNILNSTSDALGSANEIVETKDDVVPWVFNSWTVDPDNGIMTSNEVEGESIVINITLSGTEITTRSSNGADITHECKVSFDNVQDASKTTNYFIKMFGNVSDQNNVTAGTFWGFENLIDIDIPDSVTTIGASAFQECTGLTTIDLNKVTVILGGETIGRGTFGAFAFCTGLSEVNFPNDFESVGTNAFYGCSGISSVDLNNVTSIGPSAFFKCSELTSITIPDSVTDIGDAAFGLNVNLKNINISNENTSFGIAKNLNNSCQVVVDTKNEQDEWIFNFDEEFSKAIGSLAIGDLVIPNDATSVPDSAFSACSNLNSVDLSNVTSIGPRAFVGCVGLTSIVIPNSVQSIGAHAFSHTSIEFQDGIAYSTVNNPETDTKWALNVEDLSLTDYNLAYDTEGIPDSFFISCRALENILIPPQIKYIGNSIDYYTSSSLSHIVFTSIEPPQFIDENAFTNSDTSIQVHVPRGTNTTNYFNGKTITNITDKTPVANANTPSTVKLDLTGGNTFGLNYDNDLIIKNIEIGTDYGPYFNNNEKISFKIVDRDGVENTKFAPKSIVQEKDNSFTAIFDYNSETTAELDMAPIQDCYLEAYDSYTGSSVLIGTKVGPFSVNIDNTPDIPTPVNPTSPNNDIVENVKSDIGTFSLDDNTVDVLYNLSIEYVDSTDIVPSNAFTITEEGLLKYNGSSLKGDVNIIVVATDVYTGREFTFDLIKLNYVGSPVLSIKQEVNSIVSTIPSIVATIQVSNPNTSTWLLETDNPTAFEVTNINSSSWTIKYNGNAISESTIKLTLTASASGQATLTGTILLTVSQPDEPKNNNIGAIVGGTIGGLVALALIIGLIIYYSKKKKNQSKNNN